MSGTFSSFNTALSGLRYQQSALDMASTNIANATTEGYVRRRVVGETMAEGTVPAMWSRSTQPVGNGVRATGVDRMSDPLLDVRARYEHGEQAWLDTQAGALSRVETGLGEPGDAGVAAAFSAFRASLHDLANAPGSEAARGQVLAKANNVADAVNLQVRNIATEADDQRSRLLDSVAEVNTVAQDLASTNKAIISGRLGDSDTSTLEDKRDQLALRLAELTGARSTIRPDGAMDVTLNNESLVSGQTANTLNIASGVTPSGAADGSPVTFTVGSSSVVLNGVDLRGRVGGTATLLDKTLPGYLAGLSAVAQDFTDTVNAAHRAGYDLGGVGNRDLFAFNPAAASDPMSVVIADPRELAASNVPGTPGNLDAANADDIASAITGAGIEDSYQRLVSGFGITVASMRRQADNQQVLTTQVDNSREQLSGVSLDEETVNMLAAQRAYESAARLMTTLDSVLDTLINRTGLVR